MVRVKRGTTANKRRKHLLKYAKGFQWGRKSKYRLAKDAVRHAWKNAYKDRKTKKRVMRNLWQIRINAVCREMGLSYSQFIKNLKEKNIQVDRKIMSELTKGYPQIFAKIVEEVKK